MDVKDLIANLLKMAEHEGSNEHEAAIALEKAQKLLLENNLTRADVRTDDKVEDNGHIGRIDGHDEHGYSWKSTLLNVLAKNNLCYVVGHPSKKSWTLFGTKSNVTSVVEMYSWITEQLEMMAVREHARYYASTPSNRREHGKTWKLGSLTPVRKIGGRLSLNSGKLG